MISKGRLLLLLPLFLVLASGCGYTNKAAPCRVSGKITYKGKPLGGGSIAFYPEAGGVYNAIIEKDGTYSVSELPAGTMPVTVETNSAKPRPKMEYAKGNQKMGVSPAPNGQAPSGPTAENYVEIPAKYADRKSSGLSATLSAGKQVKDFDLN